MSTNPESNKESSSTGNVPPEVNVTGNVPMILSPIPASQVESASGSATVSISGVNVEKYIIKDIAKRHLGLALMELLGVVLERAAEQGKPPEDANAPFPLIPAILITCHPLSGLCPHPRGITSQRPRGWAPAPSSGSPPSAGQLPLLLSKI